MRHACCRSPRRARASTVLVEYNIPGHEGGVGGADKGKNGHRVDSIPIANGVIKTNNYCFPVKFVPGDYEQFIKVAKGVDGIIVRINPGQMDAADAGQVRRLMRECIRLASRCGRRLRTCRSRWAPRTRCARSPT